ncbi:hypothetical protein HPP92_027885 [Vanilla planifolia]|uniref:Trafficking protein particle complex subunit 9 n=2 Tax=Vanilla planifolia TaxID=51239 RepID=A0A835U579_VANPL|nr:hypothetical protein HPP92_027885 [Vanilla planifolia]
MNASDGAKSLIDASDRLILYIEIARLFSSIGYQRKAAFFSRQVAQLYLQQDNVSAAISAMQVLSMTSKAYHVQSRGTSLKHHASSQEYGPSNVESGKLHPQSVISLFESQWSTLQMVVLREILMSSVRAGDPLAAWSAAARLLRSFYPLITPAGQSGLASSLANSADRLPCGTRCTDPVLPFVRLHSFHIHPSQVDIIKRNTAKKEWWTGSAPSGPFIYTPFSKGGTADNNKQELTWIIGEPVQVLVELANPCAFDLIVESIYLSVHSENLDAFPVSVSLPPNTAKVILLSGIPTNVGPVAIPGCIVHCFGVITEHLFRDVDNLLLGAAQGLVLSDPFRCCGSVKLKNVPIPGISVVPPLPLLVSHVAGGDGATILYEGEIRDMQIRLTNTGTVPVEQAHISLSGKNQNSVISIAHETLKFGASFEAWMQAKVHLGFQRGLSKEGSSPLLVIHYAGPLQDGDELQDTESSVIPPGRRLVVPLNICVVQGLRFVKARLLSMEIPSHVTETLPKPVAINDETSEEIANICAMDSLVKLDPYRGSWELRLLELELFNPTDVVFEVNVSFEPDISMVIPITTSVDHDTCEFNCLKTRIDLNCSSRVLVNKQRLKAQTTGDLNEANLQCNDSSKQRSRASILAHEMTDMRVLIRNNTRDLIRMSFSVACRDVAGDNCIEGHNATVLWAGILSGICLEIPPLKEVAHQFSLYFLVPGEYTLVAAAIIDDANDVLLARARSDSQDEFIVCRGSPFRINVIGTV